jgi:hypothetical protein
MRHIAPVLMFVLLSVPADWSAAAAQLGDDLLLNGSIEDGKGNLPSVWFAARVPNDELVMERTDDPRHSGKYALRIMNQHKYDKQVSNNWAQKITNVPVGKAVRVEAWVKTADAEAANVCVQCWDADTKNMLAFGSTAVIRGDQDWTRVRSEPVIVPPKTETIIVRAALTGMGTVWFDDLSLKVVHRKGSSDSNTEYPPDAGNEDSPGKDVKDSGDEDEDNADEGEADLAKAAGGKIVKTLPIVEDCMVLAYMPDWDNGNVDNLGVANNQGGVRTLLRWKAKDLETLKDSLKDRIVYLALYSRQTMAKPNPGVIQVFEINDKWPERTSWKSQPGYSEKPATECKFQPGKGWKLFDITSLIQGRTESKQVNHGLMLRFQKEDFAADNWSGYQFVSREGLGEWKDRRPCLLIVEPAKKADKDKEQK